MLFLAIPFTQLTGSAVPGVDDFMITSDTLLFPAGSGPLFALPFEVPVVGDDLVENAESIQLQASILGGVAGSFSPGGDTAEISITDDDGKMGDSKKYSRNF